MKIKEIKKWKLKKLQNENWKLPTIISEKLKGKQKLSEREMRLLLGQASRHYLITLNIISLFK